MNPPRFSILLVPSTHHAVRAEKLLLQAGVTCKLIPVPRTIASDCGVCVRIPTTAAEAARRILENAGLKMEGFHDL